MNRQQYEGYISSPKWRQRREMFFSTRSRMCACCHTDENIQVHHLSYRLFGNEPDCDLMALCQRCHSLAHQWHRDKGGTIREATRACIEFLRARSALRHVKASREFVPRNQRGAKRDEQGRLLSTQDWRDEVRRLVT